MKIKLKATERLTATSGSYERTQFKQIFKLLQESGVAKVIVLNLYDSVEGPDSEHNPAGYTYAIFSVAHLAIESDAFKKISVILNNENWAFALDKGDGSTVHVGVGHAQAFENATFKELIAFRGSYTKTSF